MVKKITLIAYIALLLYASEILLHTFFPIDGPFFQDHSPYQLSQNPRMLYELRPNVDNTNLDGLHESRNYSIKKKSGLKRILIIGDSVAQGYRVNIHDNYSEKLEVLLNQRSSNQKYEVINLGVIGYDTQQIFERLKEKGLKYNPDIVIYNFWHNDYHVLSQDCEVDNNFFRTFLRSFYIEHSFKSSYLAFTLKFFLKREIGKRVMLLAAKVSTSEFFNKLPNITIDPNSPYFKLWKEYIATLISLPNNSETYYATDSHVSYIEFFKFMQQLKNIKDICNESDIRFTMLLTPVLTDFNDYKYKSLHTFAKKVAAFYNIECIDTFSQFKSHDALSLRCKPKDMIHPNKIGHELITQTILNSNIID